MNRWLQTKRYECPESAVNYLHDHGYRHELFQCPKRNQPAPKHQETWQLRSKGGWPPNSLQFYIC